MNYLIYYRKLFYLYRELHNVSRAENFTACRVTPKLFTVKVWAIFIEEIIYNDLNTNRPLRKWLINLQKEYSFEKNTADYIWSKHATDKISWILE